MLAFLQLRSANCEQEPHQASEVIIKVYFKKFPSEPNLQLTCKTTIRLALINIKMTALFGIRQTGNLFHCSNLIHYVVLLLLLLPCYVQKASAISVRYNKYIISSHLRFAFFIAHKVYSFCYAKSPAGRKKGDCHRRNCQLRVDNTTFNTKVTVTLPTSFRSYSTQENYPHPQLL